MKQLLKPLAFIATSFIFTTIANSGENNTSKSPTSSVSNKTSTAKVSYYGPGFHGRKTASGTRFNMHGISLAHKSLPFGTKVQLTCTQSGKTIVAKVTDRGPYIHGRTFDLSLGAAKALGIVERGVATVQYKILK